MIADDMQSVMAWLREPDYAEEFTLIDVGDWINRRPVESLTRIRAALGDAVREIKLGSIVEMRSDAPYADQWRGVTMKVVGLAMEPDGHLWASVIEGNPRHRGNGRYDGETTDIDIDDLTPTVTRHDGKPQP